MNKKQQLFAKLIAKAGSQNKLSAQLGVSQSTLSNLIRENRRGISTAMGARIQKFYRVSDALIQAANRELKELKINA